ncbi:MAG: efflux RND transporter periplasmic adaptor subunit [Candidatus Altimarinota bacterium]
MKNILLPIIFSSFFIISCSNENIETPEKYYQTAQVQSGNIMNNESYIGYTDSVHSIELAPKIGGKIISITKNVGDFVQSGEIIATLDGTEAKTGYTSSNEIIKNLEILKNSTSQMFDSQILVMEEKIKQAQIGIEIAVIGSKGNEIGVNDTKNINQNQLKTIDSQIQTAQTNIENALLQLENTNNLLIQKENEIYSNSKSSITNANILASNIIDFLDSIFGVTQANKYKNENFEIYLGARNSTGKNQFKQELENFILTFGEIKKLSGEEKETIKERLEKYNSFFGNDIRQLLKNAYIVLENTVENPYLSQNIIQEYKSKISELQSQNEAVILSVSGNYFLGIKGSLDAIKNFEKEKKSSLDLLEKQVELAKKQKETLENSKIQISSTGNAQITDVNTKNEIAKKQLNISENTLQEAKAGLESLKKQKQASLAEIDTQIGQVKSGKNNAEVMIENGKVTSLIDGIVTKKLAEVGNIISAGTPILIISNDTNIKINVGVPDNILQSIHIGDEVKVEIDGISNLISGNISNIFPSKDTITKKTTIEVKLPQNKNIKIGSYSKVFFNITQENKHSIIIPNNAIISKYMLPQVFILENGVAKLTHIKIIQQNDSFSEIEGLSIGQIIITDGKENIFDGEKLTIHNK